MKYIKTLLQQWDYYILSFQCKLPHFSKEVIGTYNPLLAGSCLHFFLILIMATGDIENTTFIKITIITRKKL
jgi:hypothetical protein